MEDLEMDALSNISIGDGEFAELDIRTKETYYRVKRELKKNILIFIILSVRKELI